MKSEPGKEKFYRELQITMDSLGKGNINISMGYLNVFIKPCRNNIRKYFRKYTKTNHGTRTQLLSNPFEKEQKLH